MEKQFTDMVEDMELDLDDDFFFEYDIQYENRIQEEDDIDPMLFYLICCETLDINGG